MAVIMPFLSEKVKRKQRNIAEEAETKTEKKATRYRQHLLQGGIADFLFALSPPFGCRVSC
jgi:hypothetical protein